MAKAKATVAVEDDFFADLENFDPTDDDFDLDETAEIEDEMMDTVVGATITDGEYQATLVDIKPIHTNYSTEVTNVIAGVKTVQQVAKTGKVYNFIWLLSDGRTLIDPRFTRDDPDPAKKYQSINIALGNIATQLNKITLTMRELLAEKPTLKVWVSRVGKNRNVDYLQPFAKAQPIAMNNQPPL